MSLRRRLGWATAALLVVLALLFLAVVAAQRSYLIAQVDERLTGLADNSRLLLLAANRAGVGRGEAAEVLGDAYVGLLRPDGSLVEVLQPATGAVTPVLAGGEQRGVPLTRPSVEAGEGRLRLVIVPLAGDRAVVIGYPLAGVEASSRRLLVSLGLAWLALAVVLALVAVWVQRLGLRPIAAVTAASDAIAAGGDPASVPRVTGQRPDTEAGRLATAFNTMLDATAASQGRLRQFVADASHELRTPLTTLRGYSSLYAQGGLGTPEQVADAMTRMNAEATRMGRIVDGLLDLATVEDHLALAPTDLAAMVRELAEDLRATDPERPVTVSAPDRALAIADDDRTRQAALALIANARRYSSPGAAIELRASATAGWVKVEVADHGRGIAADELPRVFDRFHRVEPSASRGSGLGLAIVAAIVSAQHGRYGVVSEPGAGSTFWFTLPAAD